MKTELDVFQKHQKKIALATLKMNDVGVSIMGGMNKPEARAFLGSIGYSSEQIARLEQIEPTGPEQTAMGIHLDDRDHEAKGEPR